MPTVKVNRFQQVCAISSLLCTAFLAGCSDSPKPPNPRFLRQTEWIEEGGWGRSDTHVHTVFSDGAHSVSEVVDRADEFGCDVLAITDHSDKTLDAATPQYFAAIEEAARSHPGMVVLAGLEWNVPPGNGLEHATVLLSPGPDVSPTLALLKARFDDYNRETPEPALAGEALRWLQQEADSAEAPPVVMINHPSRKRLVSSQLVSDMLAWREAGDVVIGFSGAPGHQYCEPWGDYEGPEVAIDRWDPAVARIGDAWDQLLQQGLDVWAARAPSDFHAHGSEGGKDYWPGEFSETWLCVPDATPSGVLRALRAGSFFGAHGHIVREAELLVATPGLDRPAFAGEAIEVAAGTKVNVTLRLQVPALDWEGKPNRIDEVELIVLHRDGGTHVMKQAWKGTAWSEKIDTGTSGFAVRARGRRIVQDGPDLMFYTNPIRVAVAATDESTSPAGSPRWLLISLLGGLGLAGCVLTVYLFIRPAETGISLGQSGASAASTIQPSRGCPNTGHFVLLTLFFLAIAVYGSLVPLTFRSLSWTEALERFRMVPYLQLGAFHRADWVANILLFIPISFCAVGSCNVDRRAGPIKMCWPTLVVLLCAALSLTLEFTQLWFPPRTVSQNDIFAETIGAVIGAALWIVMGQSVTDWVRTYTEGLRRGTTSQLDWLLQVYAVGFCIYAVLPLDLTISTEELLQKYRAGRINLIPFADAGFDLVSIYKLLRDIVLAVPLGALAAYWPTRPGQGIRSMVAGLALGFVFMVATECAQLFVYSRFSSATDVIVGTLGIACGLTTVRQWKTDGSHKTARAAPPLSAGLWISVGVVYAIALVFVFCLPFESLRSAEEIRSRYEGFYRVPFAALYWGSEFNAISECLRKTMFFAPLGVLSAMAVKSLKVSHHLSIACATLFLGLACSWGIVIEMVQVYYRPHTPDITDVILYSIGATVGLVLTMRLAGSTERRSARGDLVVRD